MSNGNDVTTVDDGAELSATAGSELDRHNAEIEKRALEAADLHLEGAQDRTRGGTKLLPIRQAIYIRIKEVDSQEGWPRTSENDED